MKSIPIALADHLTGDATTLCLLTKVVCKDGSRLAFTSLDADLTFDDGESLSYLASNAFSPAAWQQTADLSVDNTEYQGWVQDTGITEAQILSGVFDFARIITYRVNYLDLTQGKEIVLAGTAGETTFSQNSWKVEFRSKTQQLKQTISLPYSLTCNTKYGSPQCGKAFSWTTGAATSVDATEPDRIFTDSALAAADDTFRLGVVEFTSGLNTGFQCEVESHEAGVLALVFPTPFPISPTDAYRVREDCSKVWDDADHGCLHHWSTDRVSHFRGHPHVPVDGSPLVPNAEIRRSSGGGGGK